MTSAAAPAPARGSAARLDAILDRMGELQGQRNAIDAELVALVAELDHHDLWADAGARSLEACVGWRTGSSPANARALATVARRADEFPRCVGALREGRASLDQVAAVAQRAADGTDSHYAQLVDVATVPQLRRALRLAPKAEPERPTEPERAITRFADDEYVSWQIRLPHVEAATFDAALQSHRDALVAQWRRDHGDRDDAAPTAPPFPTLVDAFLRLIEAGWDADVACRPHGQRTTVVLHVDVESSLSSLHLGPALSDADRRYLSCDATVETWFERDGVPLGVGRESRQIPRRLRRALEFRHPICAVPGCGATRGLHAHHLVHWEDGGPTDLDNLALVCPAHHRMHHRGMITIRGPGSAVSVVDSAGRPVPSGPTARQPDEGGRPDAPRYRGPTGERVDWHWYDPPEPLHRLN